MASSPSAVASDATTSESASRLENEGQQHQHSPCQEQVASPGIDNMNPEERAYHERFMREAINMVSHSQPILLPLGLG